ncbi:hypothetical protein [Leclercia adecarboxylata]|uniref:hypothetical protein n=1 Tax=Leclercia adecarboxylata TaxID=83655 RepID=UPI0039AF8E7F
MLLSSQPVLITQCCTLIGVAALICPPFKNTVYKNSKMECRSCPATAIEVRPDCVSNSISAVGVGDAVKAIGTNSLSYPTNVILSCYNTTGAVTCFSTDTSYAWVTHAKSLSRGTDDATFSPPASLASKVNGQLIGVGAADSGSARTWTQRLLLEGGRA